ncbi:MAG: thioredoxin [Bacteroidetes bacterium]|nr:MAG: thioredoxin [Bacteroidota bacterium]
MGKPIEITDTNFQEVVLNSDKPVLVDFWAAWCGPCRAIAPIVSELAEDYDGKAVIGKLDVEASRETAMTYGVTNIPTLLIFKDGKIVDRHIGLTGKSVLAKKLEPHIAA